MCRTSEVMTSLLTALPIKVSMNSYVWSSAGDGLVLPAAANDDVD